MPIKHTPGPWRTGGIFDPGTPRERMNVWGPTSVGMQSGQIVAENARPADATLISAAPALADALEGIRAKLHEVGKLHVSPMDALLAISITVDDALRAAGRL